MRLLFSFLLVSSTIFYLLLPLVSAYSCDSASFCIFVLLGGNCALGTLQVNCIESCGSGDNCYYTLSYPSSQYCNNCGFSGTSWKCMYNNVDSNKPSCPERTGVDTDKCLSGGHLECTSSGWNCEYSSVTYVTEEGPYKDPSCKDGIDNDCDGNADMDDEDCKEELLCADSDVMGGVSDYPMFINYYEAGTCEDNFGPEQDKCENSNTLVEYFCTVQETCGYIKNTCSMGCSSGKCIECQPGQKQDGETCSKSSECCGSYCYGTKTSSAYTCHSDCAGAYQFAADANACCGTATYTLGKTCDPKPGVTTCDTYNTHPDYDYNRKVNCPTDECMWCGPDCPPGTTCNSCKPSAGHYCCYGTVYQTEPCEGCSSPITNAPSTSCDYIGNCFHYNSCPGTGVIVDMVNGNTVHGCMSTATTYSQGKTGSHTAHWYNIKGALGEPVNISFKNNNCKGAMNLFVYNKGDCNLYDNEYGSAIYYQVASISSTGTVSLGSGNPGVPAGFASSLEDGMVLRINKMPYGGIILAIDSDCDQIKCPYCIRIDSTELQICEQLGVC